MNPSFSSVGATPPATWHVDWLEVSDFGLTSSITVLGAAAGAGLGGGLGAIPGAALGAGLGSIAVDLAHGRSIDWEHAATSFAVTGALAGLALVPGNAVAMPMLGRAWNAVLPASAKLARAAALAEQEAAAALATAARRAAIGQEARDGVIRQYENTIRELLPAFRYCSGLQGVSEAEAVRATMNSISGQVASHADGAARAAIATWEAIPPPLINPVLQNAKIGGAVLLGAVAERATR